mgnify:CR=1 FL=1
MKFTPKFFYYNTPEWKRKKDPLICKVIYRPISFVIASGLANVGVSANAVSYFSILIAILSSLFFLRGGYESNIIAAVLLNFWLILDCVDGNLARSVKKQAFGEFADAISGYILTGLTCISIGFSVFNTGGIVFDKNNEWILLFGGIASISDLLMRLIYQKYRATLRDLVENGFKVDKDDGHGRNSRNNSIKTRIEETLGFGGILPILVLIAALFETLDVIVVYCALYFGAACFVMCLQYILKAIRNEKNLIMEDIRDEDNN